MEKETLFSVWRTWEGASRFVSIQLAGCAVWGMAVCLAGMTISRSLEMNTVAADLHKTHTSHWEVCADGHEKEPLTVNTQSTNPLLHCVKTIFIWIHHCQGGWKTQHWHRRKKTRNSSQKGQRCLANVPKESAVCN